MPQSKILVDTNSYLRLAQTIRPLLFLPFGDGEYCLYILPELNVELSNRRLKSKFPWVVIVKGTSGQTLRMLRYQSKSSADRVARAIVNANYYDYANRESAAVVHERELRK